MCNNMTGIEFNMNKRLAKRQLTLVAACVAMLCANQKDVLALDPCRKPLPPPCAADGVCRPNTVEWGVSKTRWRPWPGDVVAIKRPTLAQEEGDEEDLNLEPFQLPTPEDEDLRGPAKKETPKAEKEDAEAGVEEESLDLPGSDFLPGGGALPELEEEGAEGEADFPEFDLQGKFPATDDAPPALPSSLKKVAFHGPVKSANKAASGSILVNKSRPRVVLQTQHKPIQPIATPAVVHASQSGPTPSEPNTAFFIQD